MLWHQRSASEVMDLLDTSAQGLATAEARRRLAEHGPNAIVEGRSRPWIALLGAQFLDIPILVQLGAAFIAGLIGDPVDTIVIMAIVVLNAVIGFSQEFRAERALAALKAMAASAAMALGMRVFYRLSSVAAQGLIPDDPAVQLHRHADRNTRLRAAVWTFALAAVALIVIAPLLVISAEAVSAESGMSKSFIGTLLVGLTTSFPEVAATVAAVRLGAIELAVGNIFGSNAFNMCVLLFMDLSHTGGPVLAEVSADHVLTAQFATLCMAFGVLAIMGKLKRRSTVARFESLLIAASYGAGIWLLARG